MPTLETLTYGPHLIDYQLAFRARRSIGFQVRPDGTVRVAAPAGTTRAWVAQQVLKKADWILHHQTAFRQRQGTETGAAPTAARRYADGSTHLFQGAAFPLRYALGPRLCIVLAAGEFVVSGPAMPTAAQAETGLRAWYAAHAPALFAASLVRVWPLFAEFNLPLPTLLTRQMRSRWGSCTPRTGRIRLSPELVRAAPGCLDYVLLHECCHLLVPDHSARFYALQERLLPAWRQWKAALNALPR